MEGISVELVDVMGTDLSTVDAARVSFNKQSDFDIINEVGREIEFVLKQSDAKLIKYLADHRHMTPFRHNAISIRCKAPIFLVRQLGKHQAGLSWNEVSRRYVDSEPEFYFPEEWRKRPEGSVKQGSGDVHVYSDAVKSTYTALITGVSEFYDDLIKYGVAPEMARMVLPQSMLTEWIWTGNLLAFAHVYKERSYSGAQLEAQEFAKELDKIIRPLFPVSWASLVD